MKIRAQPAPSVCDSYGLRDNSVMPMPKQEIPPEETQLGKVERSAMPIRLPLRFVPHAPSKEVETVRIFTKSGHPWIAFAALVVWRLPLPTLALAAIFYAKGGL